MASDAVGEFLDFLRAERKRIWFNCPADIKSLKRRKGAKGQNFTTIMYAYNDTLSMIKYLYTMRGVSEVKKIDIKSLIHITIAQFQFDQPRFSTFYHLKILSTILIRASEVLKTIEAREDYDDLIGEIILYVGRLNSWIDLIIPWCKLADEFRALPVK